MCLFLRYHNRLTYVTPARYSWTKCDWGMSGTLLVPSESLGDFLWYPIDRLQKNLFKFGLMDLTDIFSYSNLWTSSYNSNCVLEFWQAHLMLTEKCQTMSFGLVKLYFSPLVLMSGHSEKRMQELLFLLLESLKSRVGHRHVALKSSH